MAKRKKTLKKKEKPARRKRKSELKQNIESHLSFSQAEEPPTYQEFNRVPNINMLNKPSWFTGGKKQEVEPEEPDDRESFQGLWKSVASIPLIALLTLPLMLPLLFTLHNYQIFPTQIASEIFQTFSNYKQEHVLMAGWAIAFFVFVPWSMFVYRLEHVILRVE